MPGHNNATNDLGPWIPFLGQKNSASPNLDTPIAAIYTRFTSSNSVKLVLQSLHNGTATDNLVIAGGTYSAGCSGVNDPGAGSFEACQYVLPSGGVFNSDGSGNAQLLAATGKNMLVATNGGTGLLTVTPTQVVANSLVVTNATAGVSLGSAGANGTFNNDGSGNAQIFAAIGKNMLVATFMGAARLTITPTEADFIGPVTSTGAVSITNATASTSGATGALVVTGGTGVGGAIFANGVIDTAQHFAIGASSGLTQTCTVNQNLTLIFTGGILTGGSCNS